MNRQAPGDKAEALTNTHIHEWLREGGTQLEVFRYLVLFLTGFVIGDLFLRAFLHARKSATRHFGQEEGLEKHELLCVYTSSAYQDSADQRIGIGSKIGGAVGEGSGCDSQSCARFQRHVRCDIIW
jgi:hypothetical protein